MNLARYCVGQSLGYCVYDRQTGTFGPKLQNKRVAVLEVKRLNAQSTHDARKG